MQLLEEIYLDWFNNYLTVEKFAEHNNLTIRQVNTLLSLARDVYYTNHFGVNDTVKAVS